MVKDRVPPFTSLLAATFLSFCALLPVGTTTSGKAHGAPESQSLS